MDQKALQRINILSRHVAPTNVSEGDSNIASLNTFANSKITASTSERAAPGTSSTYASATGQPSSYARVHGEVSKSPVQWRLIPSVSKETLQEVKYEKSIGEGIAKVYLL